MSDHWVVTVINDIVAPLAPYPRWLALDGGCGDRVERRNDCGMSRKASEICVVTLGTRLGSCAKTYVLCHKRCINRLVPG